MSISTVLPSLAALAFAGAACAPAFAQVATLPHPSTFDGTATAHVVVDLRVVTAGVPLLAVPAGRHLKITDVHAVALNGLVGRCVVSLSRFKTALDPAVGERFVVAPRSHTKLEYLTGPIVPGESTLYLLKSPLSDCDTDQFAVQVKGFWFLVP
jgi:hypothetical protein